jgi:hypothetical protein
MFDSDDSFEPDDFPDFHEERDYSMSSDLDDEPEDESEDEDNDSAYWAYIGQSKPVVDPIDDDSNDIELGRYDFTPTGTWDSLVPPSWGDVDSTDIYDGGDSVFSDGLGDDFDFDDVAELHAEIADLADYRVDVDFDEHVLTDEHLAYRSAFDQKIKDFQDRNNSSTYSILDDHGRWVPSDSFGRVDGNQTEPGGFDDYLSGSVDDYLSKDSAGLDPDSFGQVDGNQTEPGGFDDYLSGSVDDYLSKDSAGLDPDSFGQVDGHQTEPGGFDDYLSGSVDDYLSKDSAGLDLDSFGQVDGNQTEPGGFDDYLSGSVDDYLRKDSAGLDADSFGRVDTGQGKSVLSDDVYFMGDKLSYTDDFGQVERHEFEDFRNTPRNMLGVKLIDRSDSQFMGFGKPEDSYSKDALSDYVYKQINRDAKRLQKVESYLSRNRFI